MMYLGRYQLGSWIDLHLQCTDANGVRSMPDHVPQMKVRKSSDGSVVMSVLVPVLDKTIQAGLFVYRLFLDVRLSVGQWSVDFFYRVGGKYGVESRTFEILPGGDAKGCVLGMYYLHKPHRDVIVYQTESGTLEKGANPRIN
jgi:hypothetical protein